MARRGSNPGVAKGRPCRICGADAWRTEGGKWKCAPCSRRRSRKCNARAIRDPGVRLFRKARERAAAKGIEFSITPEDVRAVFPSDWLCPVLGLPMSYGKKTMHDASPTLDRLNNDWGYVPGNITVMSVRANRAKSNLRAEELEKIASWMRAKGLA